MTRPAMTIRGNAIPDDVVAVGVARMRAEDFTRG